MVRYSFLVGLFHPRLHAGLSRRSHLLTRAALLPFLSRDRKGVATSYGITRTLSAELNCCDR